MTVTITDSFVKQFSGNIHDILEREAMLLPFVTKEAVTGDKAFVERLGTLDVAKISSRHADTVLQDAAHSRRMLTVEDYAGAVMLDHQDKIKMLIDPLNPYARKLGMGMGRQVDDAIIAAALGTAKAGPDGATSVALPSGQKIAAGGTGLTFAKLLTVKKTFLANNYRGKIYGVITAAGLEDLLNETEIQSFDYNSVKALVNGEINTFMGIEFIQLEAPELVSGSKALFFGEDSIHFGHGDSMMVDIDKRADKNNNTQVLVRHSFGAVRLEEERIVEVSFA